MNELGQAPPPYAPKSSTDGREQQTHISELEAPTQSLSREQAELKPPDYTTASVRSLSDAGDASTELERPQTARDLTSDTSRPPQQPRHG